MITFCIISFHFFTKMFNIITCCYIYYELHLFVTLGTCNLIHTNVVKTSAQTWIILISLILTLSFFVIWCTTFMLSCIVFKDAFNYSVDECCLFFPKTFFCLRHADFYSYQICGHQFLLYIFRIKKNILLLQSNEWICL